MKNDAILVLAAADDPQMTILKKRLAGENIVVGDSAATFQPACAAAQVLFNWSGSLTLLRGVFALCPNLRWVHSRSAGLERTVFPELCESSVPLTNGRGVFSPSLGEFTLGAILYFAKDFRRMIRNQIAGRGEAFDVTP